jgi:hypothetical protein
VKVACFTYLIEAGESLLRTATRSYVSKSDANGRCW